MRSRPSDRDCAARVVSVRGTAKGPGRGGGTRVSDERRDAKIQIGFGFDVGKKMLRSVRGVDKEKSQDYKLSVPQGQIGVFTLQKPGGQRGIIT